MAKVKILFKSGASQEFNCDSLKVIKNKMNNSIIELKWVGLDPSPLYLGIDNIDAIFELKED